jgi:hypothetical protein
MENKTPKSTDVKTHGMMNHMRNRSNAPNEDELSVPVFDISFPP